MPRLSALLTRIACCVSAMFMLSTASSWAQSPLTLPPGYAESPEFRARLDAAAADAKLEPWQREFMRGLTGTGAAPGVANVARHTIGAADASGEWDQLPPPTVRSRHTAIYDPVRDRMVVFGGYDGSNRNDVWALSLTGTPAWSVLSPTGTLPTARTYHTAIYDPVRDRMVVFGGLDGLYRNDVWALSFAGTPAWSALNPTGTLPTGRSGHSAIYDPARDRMVVFGGYDGFGYRNDVWALSFAGMPAWSALSPAGALPTGRAYHTAIYDPVRDRMVVFGGAGGPVRNDVWALSLAGTPSWSALSPTGTLPAARKYHTAIYDPVRDRMVVFGGWDGSAVRNDVWALGLAGTQAWSTLGPTGSLPAARETHTAIYDPVRDRMIVFGGWDSTNRNDTWLLSLADTPAWSALSPTGTLPPVRTHHTAIYDPVRSRMVVFGGYDGSASRNDIWALSLAGTPAWSALSPTGPLPTGRSGHTAIYDPIRDRMVVFGGYDGSGYRNEVWALSLAGVPAWSALSPMGTLPTGRAYHTAAYDPLRDRVVVFGGYDGSASRNDVWELSLAGTPAWSTLSPTGTLPAARYLHTAIYDLVSDRMVVFGGNDGFSPYRNDVWALSLAGAPEWSALSPTGTLPTARVGHTAIYDPARDRMIVFGGLGAFSNNDVWALALAGTPAWSALSPTGTLPTGRSGHTAIYDPVRDHMVVFGGDDYSAYHNEVCRLNWPLLVAVDPQVPPVLVRFEFAPPRPNPSHGSVSFDISIPHASPVSLEVYDSAGRIVHRIADAPFSPGRHVLVWDRRNDDGRVVPSGIFFVRLQAPGVLLTRKTVLIQ